MSGTGCIDQLNITIDSKFTELQQQLIGKMCKMSDEIHKKLRDESQKIVEEHEEQQQFKEQHNHLIEPDPMSNVVKVS
jgi:diadenosine tetraphosphate (Ap4A) HIT family hydrolase